MAYTAPQDVLDYYKGYNPTYWADGSDPSTFGGWFQDYLSGSPYARYTDQQGFQWMPNMQGGKGISDSSDCEAAQYLGLRRGEIAGELNDPFRAEATNLYFDPQGNYQYTNTDDPGWLTPATGILAVVGAGLGAAALGGAAAAGSGAAGAGAAGAEAGAGLGAGAATGADLSAFYGGLDGAATLGGGASINGGAALGGASAMGAGAGGGAGGVGGAGGTPPPANPYASGATDWSSMLSNGVQNMEMGDWAKLASAALGAYGGSQGTQNTQTTQNQMDPRLAPYLYGDLFPRTQGLLGSQFGQAQAQSGAMNNVGMGLLNTNPTPDMANNPYMTGVANDIQRRTGDLLGQNFNNIRGQSIMSGGLGGSRQGVAEGEAMKGAADSLQGQLSNLYYGAYNQDSNRNLQKIGIGAGLLGQSQQQAYAPLNQASDLYRPYTGLNSSITTGSNQGGGWMGALGGALGGAQWAQNMWGTK